jgi:acyl-CoA synthetase (NDP forming)
MLALLVDACEGVLGLSEFNDDTIDRLQVILPRFTSTINPVDVTGAVVEDEALLVDTVSAVLEDPGVEAVIAGLDNRGYDRLLRNADLFIASARAQGKPIVFSLWDPPVKRDVAAERRLASAAVLIADDPSEAVSPLSWLVRASAQQPARHSALRAFDSTGELRTWPGIVRLADALKAAVPATWLLEPSDPVPTSELTEPPYVVKPVPNAVVHKSDQGLVRLHLHSMADVASAVQQVRNALGPYAPVLIQRMVTGVETLVSAGHDPDWGPVLTLGAGGTLVELLNDVVHLALPCDEPAVRAALERLGIQPLLKGYRDTAPADVDGLVDAVMRLQRILLTHEDAVGEIELNPLVVGPTGHGVCVIDVLVTERSEQGQ